MESLRIKIQTLEDAEKERNAMPELKPEDCIESEKMTVCIMEDMTVNHKAGVSFTIQMKNGKSTTHLLTENIMEGLIQAYKGAIQRFEELKSKRK